MFSASVKSSTSPRTLAILGDVAEARVERLAGGRGGEVLSRRPRSGRTRPSARPRQCVDQLRLAVAVDSRDARRSRRPGPRTRRHAPPPALARREPPGPRRSSSGSPGCGGAFSTRSRTSRPTMRRARLSSVAPARGHGVDLHAAPEHRDAVGDLQHLVQLVADEDDGLALPRERADDLEELVRLLRRQDRRRLVEDEDLRLPVERLQDLDALLLADGDRLHPVVRVDVEPERHGDGTHPLLALPSCRRRGRAWAPCRARCSPRRS